MKRSTLIRSVVTVILVGCLSGAVRAQVVNYSFTSGSPGGDGFNWPASPTGQIDNDYFLTPHGIEIYNAIGNSIFYDSNYQTLGNGIQITGDALWGNPQDIGSGGYVGFDLSTFSPGQVTEVSFDFAWTESNTPATYDFLSIYFEDSEGRANFNSYQLTGTFTGLGGSTGYEDFLSFDTAFLTDDFFNVDGGNFVDIAYMEIYVDEIFFGGNSSEFAIDNFATNSGGGGLDPDNSNVQPGQLGGGLIGQSSKWLRTTGTSFTSLFPFEVSNDGTGGTTYSVTVGPGSDPEWVVDAPATNAVIYGGEQIDQGSGNVAYIDRNNPSGTYVADVIVSNDLNPLDPDETVTWTIEIYDEPALSDNAGATVQVDLNNALSISNATAGPHAGALRAGVEVSNLQTSGPFKFDTSTGDLVSGAFVSPGETKTAYVEFDRYGRLNGAYNGTASVSLVMNSAPGSYLNGDPPVPDTVWNLSYNLGTIGSDSVAVNNADPLGPGVLGINGPDTAATILDGTSSKSQTVSMAFSLNPDLSSADLAGEPIELTFSGAGVQEQYVLQFTYLDANIPGGVTESQLQVLFYDTIAGEWDVAVDGNSGGATAFFAGSYADYLAGPGGSALDAGDLGAFGVDTLNNHAWAVLDHASTFGVGVLTAGPLVGDLNGDGFVGIADLNIVLGNWNQNVTAGEWTLGDPSGDGFVGIADLNEVLGNWNAGTPPTENSTIPEPGTFVLLGPVCVALARRWS